MSKDYNIEIDINNDCPRCGCEMSHKIEINYTMSKLAERDWIYQHKHHCSEADDLSRLILYLNHMERNRVPSKKVFVLYYITKRQRHFIELRFDYKPHGIMSTIKDWKKFDTSGINGIRQYLSYLAYELNYQSSEGLNYSKDYLNTLKKI